MPQAKSVASAPSSAPEVVPAIPVQAPLPMPPVPTAVPSVGVPTTATDELSKLVPANGQMSGLTVILAAIAVLGGGAAWKFYSQHSKEKHEQKMKEMELKASQPQDQHPSCKSDSTAIHQELRKLADAASSTETAVTTVTQRVDRLENKIAAPELGENLTELEDRVKKLEKNLPKPPRRGATKA